MFTLDLNSAQPVLLDAAMHLLPHPLHVYPLLDKGQCSMHLAACLAVKRLVMISWQAQCLELKSYGHMKEHLVPAQPTFHLK